MINGYHYIKSKQINWALNRGLKLQGSKRDRGEKAYTMTLEENLFEPLLDTVKEQFKKGKGGELEGDPCPMQAVHSSVALVVNVFQYWIKINDYSSIIEALGFPKIECEYCKFEKKFPVCRETPPHLDVVFSCKNEKEIIIAIESKFTEPYSSRGKKEEMHDAYFENNLFYLWEDIPHVKKLAEKIRIEKTSGFNYLYADQLIKHLLGLKKQYKKKDFYLVYLWYNIPGEEGYFHEQEIKEIGGIFKADGINFQTITYQELLFKLAENCRETHARYIEYLTERYL
ncbi:hypothetical protein JCM12298_12850 [Desulfothermus naphthae]